MPFIEKPHLAQNNRFRFDLNNAFDLAEIKEFEKELDPFMKRTSTICGNVLKGFYLYLHEKEMFRYSTKYPQGAVVFDNLENYRIADMKYRALTELWNRRKKAEEKEKERIQTLIPQAV